MELQKDRLRIRLPYTLDPNDHNLWGGGGRKEITIDLSEHSVDSIISIRVLMCINPYDESGFMYHDLGYAGHQYDINKCSLGIIVDTVALKSITHIELDIHSIKHQRDLRLEELLK